VRAAEGTWVQVLVCGSHASSVHPLPSPHWPASVQHPAMGLRPQTPPTQVAGLQVEPGQSLGAQHAWQVPLQSLVPLGHPQAPSWQTCPPPPQRVPFWEASAAVTQAPPLQVAP
jgi:hypothetical protein